MFEKRFGGLNGSVERGTGAGGVDGPENRESLGSIETELRAILEWDRGIGPLRPEDDVIGFDLIEEGAAILAGRVGGEGGEVVRDQRFEFGGELLMVVKIKLEGEHDFEFATA